MAKDLNKIVNKRTVRRTVTKGAAAAAAGAGAANYVKPGLRALGVPIAGAAVSGGVGPPPPSGGECGRMTGGGGFDGTVITPIVQGLTASSPKTGPYSITGATVLASASGLTATSQPTGSFLTASSQPTYNDGITLYCCFIGDILHSGVNFELNWSDTVGTNTFHMVAQVQGDHCADGAGGKLSDPANPYYNALAELGVTRPVATYNKTNNFGLTLCDGEPITTTGGPATTFRTITGYGIGSYNPPGTNNKYEASIIFSLTDNHESNQGADLSYIQVFVNFNKPFDQKTQDDICVGVGTKVVNLAGVLSVDKNGGNYQAHNT